MRHTSLKMSAVQSLFSFGGKHVSRRRARGSGAPSAVLHPGSLVRKLGNRIRQGDGSAQDVANMYIDTVRQTCAVFNTPSTLDYCDECLYSF